MGTSVKGRGQFRPSTPRQAARGADSGRHNGAKPSCHNQPFLLETTGYTAQEKKDLGDPMDFLRETCNILRRRTGDGILLGEVNIAYEDQYDYFGGEHGDGLALQFDFIGMQSLYLAMARRDATPLVEALRTRAGFRYATETQWANFLRNHDELTLDKLTDAERQEVFEAFGPEKRMQVYDRGLKRRLPPMLEGDPRRIRMAYSLMFALPGTPSLFYGEEIGMGENLDAKGRMAVRTPMQWTSEDGAGFTNAPPRRRVAPFPTGGYAPDHVNVADQRPDPESLYSFVRTLIFLRRRHPELGWAPTEILDVGDPSVLVLAARGEEAAVVTVHNLGPDGTTVTVSLDDVEPGSRLVDLWAQGPVDDDPTAPFEVQLDGYGHRWFRIQSEIDTRLF